MALTSSTYQITAAATIATGYGNLNPSISFGNSLTLGAAAQQVNCANFTDFIVTAGTAKTFDLIGGGMVQPDGTGFNPTAVKEMFIANLSTASTLTVGGNSNAWATWLGGTAQTVTIPPGGHLHITAPVGGFAVTATTGDILQFTSSTGTASVTMKLAGVY